MTHQSQSSSNLQRLAGLLREPQTSSPIDVCRRYQSELPLFVTDELAGRVVEQYFGGLADHLDRCPNCLREYVTLAELMNNALLDVGNV